MGEVTKVTVDPGAADGGGEGGSPRQSGPLPDGEQFANLRAKFNGENAVMQLAESYVELEKRLGGEPGETKDPAPAPRKGLEAGEPDKPKGEELLSMDALSDVFQEYNEKGELSDDTYAKLAGKGIDRSLVDNVIEGQLARAERIEREGLEVVGGRENYDLMTGWAAKNLSESELRAYNASVQSGDVAQARLAVEALAFRYSKANGSMPDAGKGGEPSNAPPPRRVEGKAGPETAEGGYRDMSELTKDLADPRYETSPAFRADVDRRARLMSNDALNSV